jgi:hypothetical protein
MSKHKEPFEHDKGHYGHEQHPVAGPGGAGDLHREDAPHKDYGQVPMGTEGRPMIDVITCDLAASGKQRIDTGSRTIRGIIVSVTQGQLDVYLGEFSSGVAPRVPHWHFTAIGRPVHLWLPKGRYVFTVFAGSTEALIGSITPIGGD